jgi:hypothetical protein
MKCCGSGSGVESGSGRIPKNFAGSGVGSGINHFGSGSAQSLLGMNLKQNFSDKNHNFSTKCTIKINKSFFPTKISLKSLGYKNISRVNAGSRILIKEFIYFNPKKAKKWFQSSKKYDPGCSSRIPDPDADFLPSRIPDPGVKKAPNPGSRIRNTGYRATFSRRRPALPDPKQDPESEPKLPLKSDPKQIISDPQPWR